MHSVLIAFKVGAEPLFSTRSMLRVDCGLARNDRTLISEHAGQHQMHSAVTATIARVSHMSVSTNGFLFVS